MKQLLTILLIIVIGLSSCEKLEIPHELYPETNGKINALSVYEITNGEIYEAFEINEDTIINNVWIEGYIVGYVNGTRISSAVFAIGEKKTNLIIASNPEEKNINNCVPVELAGGTNKIRETLNLSDNPNLFRKKIYVYGNIQKYMGAIGIKKIQKFAISEEDDEKEENINKDSIIINEFDNEDPNDENNQDNNETGDENENIEGTKETGSEEKPFSINSINNEITTFMENNGIVQIPEMWVHGYIVGYIQGTNISKSIFSAGEIESNIIIADSPDETDYNQCIAIQLSTGSTYQETRNKLNLHSHPENIKKKVIILGAIEKYMGKVGLKKAKKYIFE